MCYWLGLGINRGELEINLLCGVLQDWYHELSLERRTWAKRVVVQVGARGFTNCMNPFGTSNTVRMDSRAG